MAAALLIYHMEEDRRMILEGLCRSLDIRPVHVENSMHRAPVGLLSGNADVRTLARGAAGVSSKGDKTTDAKAAFQEGMDLTDLTSPHPISEEMIVMCDFTKPQFDALLEALKMAGLRIGLKAVETPHNQAWSGEMLQEELSREREAFRRRS